MSIIPFSNGVGQPGARGLNPTGNAASAARRAVLAALRRRHPDYREFAEVWRWLQDSLEGGTRYKDAVYGTVAYQQYMMQPPYDSAPYGQAIGEAGSPSVSPVAALHHFPRKNLVRHPREYPIPKAPGQARFDDYPAEDQYELRLARTPVPTFVGDAIKVHLGKIYSKEIRRVAAPPPADPADPEDADDRRAPPASLGGLEEWWEDCDGRGTRIDDWMRKEVAPLYSVIGHLDILIDHPPVPDGEEVVTLADSRRLGLSGAIARVIIPENLLDWDDEPRGRWYTRAMVKERRLVDQENGMRAYEDVFRLWTTTDWTLYDTDGEIVDRRDHSYGVVPIVHHVEERKGRNPWCGHSAYEGIAEIQREYYNLDSEDILANSLQAHATLSGPEEMVIPGGNIQVGPSNVLPKKKKSDGTYEGWEYVDPPKDSAAARRDKLADLIDRADRAAHMLKPAGAAGTGKTTVAQSGISKMMDMSTGNDMLLHRSKSLEGFERALANMVACVQSDGAVPFRSLGDDAFEVTYPQKFDLFTAGDIADLTTEFQSMMGAVGEAPETEKALIKAYVRQALPGLPDSEYARFDAEIEERIDAAAARLDVMREAQVLAPLAVPAGRVPTLAGAALE